MSFIKSLFSKKRPVEIKQNYIKKVRVRVILAADLVKGGYVSFCYTETDTEFLKKAIDLPVVSNSDFFFILRDKVIELGIKS